MADYSGELVRLKTLLGMIRSRLEKVWQEAERPNCITGNHWPVIHGATRGAATRAAEAGPNNT